MPKEKETNQGWDIHWESDEKAQYLADRQKEKEENERKEKDKNDSRNYDPLNFYLPGE